MKKIFNEVLIPFICGALIGLCFLGIFTLAFAQGEAVVEKAPARNYGLISHVIEIDRKSDVVTVEDEAGHLWQFCGVEDWFIGDCIVLTMCDEGTIEIYDDTIIATTYSAS